jgi:hypothetical protein
MMSKSFSRIFVVLVVSQALQLRGAPPQLAISQSGPQVTISWQDTNNWLQSATALGSPSSWVNVPAAPLVVGGNNSLTLTADQPAMFYRLVFSPFLPPPTELTVSSQADTNFNYYFDLAWDAVPGAASYNVYMASVSGVDKSNYASLPDGRVFTGITTPYALIPDVPDMVFLPTLVQGVRYYFVVTAVSASAAESADSNEASGIYGASGGVNGSVYTQVVLGTNAAAVSLPGVLLALVNTTNSAFSATVTSDINGLFTFPDQPAGDYQLCWQATGFISGCLTQSITISNADIGLDPIALYPDTNATVGLIYGQVTFQDGSTVFQQDSFFQINVNARVTLADTSGTRLQTVSPNSAGLYAMGGVPRAGMLSLSATVENAGVTNSINTFVMGEADLVIPNTPPTIQSVVASLSGQPVYRAPAGATVQATANASDPDPADTLTFKWFAADGSTPYPATSNISWALPNVADGLQYLFVRVSDGKGGYATARLDLTTNPYLIFSGQVTGSDSDAPLPNAFVQLNGFVTSTDTNGYFSLLVTQANEYDLTITNSGYAPLAKVWLDQAPDQQYRLLRISSYAGADCTNNAPFSTSFSNEANGVVLTIPDGALLDASSNTYTGCIRVTMDTLDPCDPTNSFLGGNLTTNGGALESFALVNIGVWDFLGNPLTLNLAYAVDLFVPIATACNDPSNPPPAAQFFAPSAPTNRWVVLADGVPAMKLVGSTMRAGFEAAGALLGFLQVAKADPTTTLDLVVDDSLHVPLVVGFFNDAPFVLLPDPPKPGRQIDSYQVISTRRESKTVRVAPGTTIWIEVLNPRQAPGEYYQSLGSQKTPDRIKDVVQALKLVANPNKTVTLGLGVKLDVERSAPLKLLLQDKLPGLRDGFLTIRNGNQEDAAEYYQKIDAKRLKRDFLSWQKENGWTTTRAKDTGGVVKFPGHTLVEARAGDDEFALYFNANDLGAGRRMGMKIFPDKDMNGNYNEGPSVAYYVATYATLADAENDVNLKYIVCMDYSFQLDASYSAAGKPLSPTKYVKFYAYDNKGVRLIVVPDEGPVPRNVPYLCMVCHGAGSEADAVKNSGDVSGQFVGFDTANYTFSGTIDQFKHDYLFANANRMVNDKTNVFSSLNDGLRIAQFRMPTPLQELIGGLIDGEGYATVPPGGWKANLREASLYRSVYAVSCRSCHATQGNNRTPGAYNWGSAAAFTRAKEVSYAASPVETPVMPHTQRTYSIFWGSATAKKLNDLGIVSQSTQSQPAILSNGGNDGYFP